MCVLHFQLLMYTIIIVEKRNQEMQETMLKARDAKYSVPVRYGKVLFCGAAAAGKSNFLKLLMKEDFQKLHISTEVLKPQQVTIAVKAVTSSNDDEVEFKKMSIDNEILQLESYLPKEYTKPTENSKKSSLKVSSQDKIIHKKYIATTSAAVKAAHDKHKVSEDNFPNKHTLSTTSLQESSLQTHLQYPGDKSSANKNRLALANVKRETKELDHKTPGEVWDILTFMDTGGQPQFISMLPAVNSFAMITFIVHRIEKGGQNALNEIVKVQYGNEKGEISYKPHPHKYTYLQLIETLISYASNILLPDTKFLDTVKIESKRI